MNLVNPRREFFTVTLQELEEFAKAKNLSVEMTKLAEAKEYRQSLVLREKARLKALPAEPVAMSAFPDSL